MLVRVYRNLHKKCLSVQAKVNGRWKVIKHVNSIYLEDVTFKVSQAGRQRVLRENKKNVHAFVIGWYSELYNDAVTAVPPSLFNVKRVCYNPYKHDSFVIENLFKWNSPRKIVSAKKCLISDTILIDATIG